MSDKKEQNSPKAEAKDDGRIDPAAEQLGRVKVAGGEPPDNLRRRADWFRRRSGGKTPS